MELVRTFAHIGHFYIADRVLSLSVARPVPRGKWDRVKAAYTHTHTLSLSLSANVLVLR